MRVGHGELIVSKIDHCVTKVDNNVGLNNMCVTRYSMCLVAQTLQLIKLFPSNTVRRLFTEEI